MQRLSRAAAASATATLRAGGGCATTARRRLCDGGGGGAPRAAPPRAKPPPKATPPKRGKPDVRELRDVLSAAERRRRAQAALDNARWVTSWMMPWERAQMDSPSTPLSVWERVYWRLFVALGGVGLIYETWVLGNRRLWTADDPAVALPRPHSPSPELYRRGELRSTTLMSDDDIEHLTPDS